LRPACPDRGDRTTCLTAPTDEARRRDPRSLFKYYDVRPLAGRPIPASTIDVAQTLTGPGLLPCTGSLDTTEGNEMNRIGAARFAQRTAVVMALSLPLTFAAIGSAVSAPNFCRGEAGTITGTPGADVIRGTARDDSIVALGGNDVVRGLGGNDEICGGPGADRLVGGDGRDTLDGAGGNDTLIGGNRNDDLFGGPGADQLFGGAGPDQLIGGAGRDTSNGGPGSDDCIADSELRCESQ
jgi:hypothetical protein